MRTATPASPVPWRRIWTASRHCVVICGGGWARRASPTRRGLPAMSKRRSAKCGGDGAGKEEARECESSDKPGSSSCFAADRRKAVLSNRAENRSSSGRGETTDFVRGRRLSCGGGCNPCHDGLEPLLSTSHGGDERPTGLRPRGLALSRAAVGRCRGGAAAGGGGGPEPPAQLGGFGAGVLRKRAGGAGAGGDPQGGGAGPAERGFAEQPGDGAGRERAARRGDRGVPVRDLAGAEHRGSVQQPGQRPAG